jgi:L-alanine-DL-glutamate epimerase-like enolase superfamily enzyme
MTPPTLRDRAAVHAALDHGMPLYVLNPQLGWIPGGAGSLRIAARAADHHWALWIYGAEPPPPEQRCAGCWHPQHVTRAA